MSDDLPVRMSVRELYDPHNPDKNKEKRYALLKAWRYLNDLPPEKPNSFYAIAGYHGVPFVPFEQKGSETWSGITYWGGYCQHQNVLFPFWHRLYLVHLEKALQKVEPKAMIPYWDQTSHESLKEGIPALLTEEKVKISDDGEEVENPLRSFKLKREINRTDQEPTPDGTEMKDVDFERYIKPMMYETKRYPFAGLLGPKDKEQTEKHNEDLEKKSKEEITKMLNAQIKKWLRPIPHEPNEKDYRRGIYDVYKQCLDAPTYNIFSNTSTAGTKKIYGLNSLENPHNWMHLAIGGFPYQKNQARDDKDFIDKASGDMAFNEIAAFDPIFFMHHCNVDRMFWIWQKLHKGMTDKLEIDERDQKDPGVFNLDGQGVSPNQSPNQKLTLDTPLHPFKDEKDENKLKTSRSAINIETQLNYTYSKGSFFKKEKPEPVDSDGVTFNELDITKEKDAEEKFKNDVREYYRKNEDFGSYKKMITSVKVHVYKPHIQQAGSDDPVDKCFDKECIVTVENIKIEDFGGSFAVYLSLDEEEIGVDAFFARLNRRSCANCQVRPGFVIASFDITDIVAQKEIRSENLRAHTQDNSGLASKVEEPKIITLYRVYKPRSIKPKDIDGW